MISRRLTRSIAIGASAVAIAGGAYGIVSVTAGNGSSAATTSAAAAAPSGRFAGGGGGGSNARSAPSAGGAVGNVSGVSSSGFTLTTPAGQKVTVTTTSSASAVKNGQTVLVLGTTDGTTIAAGQMIVQKTGSTTASAVVPFQRGAPSTAKQVGQVPTNYTQGSGTIVSGTAANKATQAALAAYPGGVVNRVVKLSNGTYEVHNVGVNWPHHIFVNASFKVVGAN
jgi:hypothetical protein